MGFFFIKNKWIQNQISHLSKLLSNLILFISILDLILMVIWFGYEVNDLYRTCVKFLFDSSLFIFFIHLLTQIYNNFKIRHIRRNLFYLFLTIPYFLFFATLFLPETLAANTYRSIMYSNTYVALLTGISAVVFLSKTLIESIVKRINPFLLMSFSFFFVIVAGTILLSLPRSVHAPVSFVDTLFIVTSGVCVTGLSPLTISETFTLEGQTILMLLIQIGGLGVMTITSFFGVFFIGSISLSNQFALNNILSTESVGSLLKMLLYVFGFTIVFELTGATLMWLSVHGTLDMHFTDEVFFCLFHSVSAFCNAGFSTLPEGLASPLLTGNNLFYWIVSSLIICGGIGFPILANLTHTLYIYAFKMRFNRQNLKMHKQYHILSLNSKIVLTFTAFLLTGGAAMFALGEWTNEAMDFSAFGKISHSFFLSASARTAGFNSFDLTMLSLPSVLLLLFLMWIGGGAQSTAGGIKVNVFAVAFYTIVSVMKGKTRVEIGHREISNDSILRVLTTISLSLFLLGISTFMILLLEKDKSFISILFECMSAMTTTGLSLNLTGSLENGSKIILILLMFIGRVGFLTFFMGFSRQIKSDKYRYPIDNIIIN
ncbi:MAG: TrkH family potassium uptake protein [Bacteroidales bacterium]